MPGAKSRVRCLPTNLAKGQGAIRRAAGIERRASLVIHKFQGPSFSYTGEGSTDGGSLADATGGPGGVMTAARRKGLSSKLERPSWSRRERRRSKVSAGNSDEDQRESAGRIVVVNRRQRGGTPPRAGDVVGVRPRTCEGAQLVDEPQTR